MPKRLAITIAGAVSLGSYEAGVLYEVLDAIHQHNTASGVTDDEKILIDVMTGASAGAMTAAIVAQKMLYSADEFRDPYDNPLYNVWVKRINLKGLLETGNAATGEVEPALHSLFSSKMVEKIFDMSPLRAWVSLCISRVIRPLVVVAIMANAEHPDSFVTVSHLRLEIEIAHKYYKQESSSHVYSEAPVSCLLF